MDDKPELLDNFIDAWKKFDYCRKNPSGPDMNENVVMKN